MTYVWSLAFYTYVVIVFPLRVTRRIFSPGYFHVVLRSDICVAFIEQLASWYQCNWGLASAASLCNKRAGTRESERSAEGEGGSGAANIGLWERLCSNTVWVFRFKIWNKPSCLPRLISPATEGRGREERAVSCQCHRMLQGGGKWVPPNAWILKTTGAHWVSIRPYWASLRGWLDLFQRGQNTFNPPALQFNIRSSCFCTTCG